MYHKNEAWILNRSFEYLDKQARDSTQQIHEESREEIKNNMKTIVLDGSKLRGGQHLFPDKTAAQQHFIKEINALIDRSYDNYRYKASDKSNHVFCGVFNRATKDLLGLMVLLKKNCRGAQYCEFGVSLVDERYRGFGIQTITAKEMQNYAITLLEQGYPLYSTTRSFSAHTQFQMWSIRLPNKAGKFVSIASARGFAPYYVFEKDDKGDFFLEFHMLFDSWRTLDEVVSKFIYLPPNALEKNFHIFDSKYRPDLQPMYAYPVLRDSGEIALEYVSGEPIIYPEIDYLRAEWLDLAKCACIIGHEDDEHHIKKSPSLKFDYSDTDSPNPDLRVIQIECIHSFGIAKDFDLSMKSINITVQIAEFQDEKVKAANIALLFVLFKEGFVPASVHDVLYHGKRIRVSLLSRWQGIKVQSKFEIILDHKKTFEIFKHDCNVQGYFWPIVVNILDPERLKEKYKDETKSPIILDRHLPTMTKNVEFVNQVQKQSHVSCSLVDTPFFKPLERFSDRFHKNVVLEFASDFEELDNAFFEQFERVLTRITENFAPFINWENGVDAFSINIQGTQLKLKLENKH